ncbi:MAG: phosphoribosylaminoimidazolesuccinocarboxamide synthase [Myxococcales bacterium]|nr:phosphoribosylaminoimidazolesuccinocarboxamide synthase [Myxococcota bacterium]MDW8284110.1 phosphoribosylaminoimidazolesuccinocarboxamide synthase [Myxococcales bacterium]
MPLEERLLRQQMDRTLSETDLRLPGVLGRVRGKVRDSYLLGDGRRVIVCTDRISAFDVVLGTIPWKGQVLNELAAFWFQLSRHVAPNHLVAVPDPNVMVVRDCRPIPVEFVMRAYLTGVTTTSIWYAYSQGRREFCGHILPEGLRKNEPLPQAILTPSTKAAAGAHDESVSAQELVRRGLVTQAQMDLAAALCARLFAFGQQQARQRGLILVDTKYELGLASNPGGGEELLVIDEIHTPDSSRYWYADDYEERLRRQQEPRSLDKEYVRQKLVADGYTGQGPPPPLSDELRAEAARRYVAAYELLTGRPFQPDLAPPQERIARNLEEYLR